MTTQRSRRSASAALFLSSGLAVSAWGQASQPTTPHQPDRVHADRDHTQRARTAYTFLDADALRGEDVENANGDDLATIDDFIVDRGSGRIQYAILTSGSVLGIGGKDIAVPYAALRYNAAEECYTIDMTEEQIERAASFSPEDWSNLDNATWTEDLENWWDETFSDGEDDDDWRDPYTQSLEASRGANQSPTTIEGEITRVVREDHGTREHTCVEVKGDDGAITHVVLGPSWFVMGGAAAPMRGDQITADVVPSTTDGKNSYIALHATIEGERLELRDKDGMARWHAPSEPSAQTDRRNRDQNAKDDASLQNRRYGSRQLMLISKLDDAPASASDESGGEIQQVIMEESSGQIAFIGFDPNDNVLGIGDDIVLVPWTLVSVGPDHKVRIDGSKDMLVASEEVPDDLDTVRDHTRLSAIYTAFGVDVPEFRARSGSRDISMSQWKSDGQLVEAFREGEELTITGRIVDVRKEALISGEPDAVVVVVKTDSGQQQRVVVGPSWYVSRQAMEFKEGDTINVTGHTATFNGVEHVGARSVTCGDRTFVLWSDDDAVWNDD
jgi:sporulation protein YlmC with PRC-barrel domain